MFLLDTNVVSELRKVQSGRTSPDFIAWALQTDTAQHFLSVASIQEIELGILLLEKKDPRQARVLREWFTTFVLPEFQHRILPVTVEIARRSAYLFSRNTKSYPDSLIAATAYVHNLTVVTRNTKDFGGAGIRIVNPWDTP